MSSSVSCPECGAVLPQGHPTGMCPRCALSGLLKEVDSLGGPHPASGHPLPPRFAKALRGGESDGRGAGGEGRFFGDYELLEEIARGGMGVVYKARQKSLDRVVAVKLLLAGPHTSDDFIKRFRVEASAAAGLQHPNIVAIHEVGVHEGEHFLAMEFVDGPNLAALVRERPLLAKRAAGYLQTIAQAIHYAHERGILHRDLKPSNVLLDEHDQPRVTDFGLAKRVGTESQPPTDLSELTLSGQVMGSPAYMPPEQASGKRGRMSRRSDVYSLGAMLYHLLTGRPPFVGGSPAETLRQVETQEPVSLRLLNPALALDLETICQKCLEKEPSRRYATALELAEELGRFLKDETIRARPVGRPEKFWRWCRRKPALAALLVLLPLVGVIGLAGVLWQWQRAEDYARAEGRERRTAQAAVTRLEIEKAETLFANDDSSRALASLARLLRREPTNGVVAARILSALSRRAFCLPLVTLAHERPLDSAAIRSNAAAVPGLVRSLNAIRTVEHSPDGRLILTAGKDGTVRLWNARTGAPAAAPMRHDDWVLSVQFTSDGERIVSASLDGTARLWQTHTGEPFLPPLRHEAPVLFAAFNRENTLVVTTTADKAVHLWDARTGQRVGAPLRTKVAAYCASFSPDGRQLLLGTVDEAARLLDAKTGREIKVLPGICQYSPHHVPGPQFSPDGEWVVAAATLNGVLWSVRSRGIPASLSHDGEMVMTRFSPDGALVATASWDTSARLWDVSSGQAVGPPLNHEDWVNFVHFSSDKHRLATASKDRSARIWDIRSGRSLTEPIRQDVEVSLAQFNPLGDRLLTLTTAASACLWEIRQVQSAPITLRHPNRVRRLAISPEGKRVATATTFGVVGLWDAQSGRPLIDLIQASGYIYSVRFNPEGTRLVTASSTNAEIWDAAEGRRMAVLAHRSTVYEAQFSRDGQRVLTASGDGTSCIWDARTGQQQLQVRHRNMVHAAAFSPDGRRFLTASYDGTAQVWDAASGQPVGERMRHDDVVQAVSFSPDGKRVVTASQDKTARVWDAATGKMLLPPLIHAYELYHWYSAQFDPTGVRIATAAGNAVQIWDARTGQSVTPPLKHPARVNSIAFSPDGRRLVTTCFDGGVRIFDVATGHAISETLRHEKRAACAEFSPEGTFIATGSDDNTARLWEVPPIPMPLPGWLPELAEAVAGQRLDGQSMSSMVPLTNMLTLKHRLLAATPGAPTPSPASPSGYYAAWARWFFAEGDARTLSPLSPVTHSNYVRRLIEEDSPASLQEATRLAPGHPLAQVRWAYRALTNGTAPASRPMAELEWQIERAIKLAPGEPEVWRTKSRIFERQGRLAEAMEAIDRAIHLQPTKAAYRLARGELLERTNRLEEALQEYTQAIDLTDPGRNSTNVIATSDARARLSIRRSALFRRGELLVKMNRLDEARPDLLQARGIPERDPSTPVGCVDLSVHYTATLERGALDALPKGIQTFKGVAFDVRAVVVLKGSDSLNEEFPDRRTGIRVGQRCRRLHFLHSVNAGAGITNHAHLASYLVHYVDGETLEIPLKLNEDFLHLLHPRPPAILPSATAVWRGKTPTKEDWQLWKRVWDNPRPEVGIASLDFRSTLLNGSPILIAITAE